MAHANADAYAHSPSMLDDEERAIREVVREFAVEELRPGARPTRPRRSPKRRGTSWQTSI